MSDDQCDAEVASKCSICLYLFVSSHTTAVCGMQGAEIWQELGEWITANKPQFGPGTKERFEMASKLTPEEVTPHASLHTDLHGTHVPPFLPSFHCSPMVCIALSFTTTSCQLDKRMQQSCIHVHLYSRVLYQLWFEMCNDGIRLRTSGHVSGERHLQCFIPCLFNTSLSLAYALLLNAVSSLSLLCRSKQRRRSGGRSQLTCKGC